MRKPIAAIALLAAAGAVQAGYGTINFVPQPTTDGSEATPYDFGTLSAAPTVLAVTLPGLPGSSFEEHANFTISTASDVSGVANTYALTFGANLVDIEDLTINVWDGTHPFGSTNIATFSGNNAMQWFGELAAGQYHLDIVGNFSSLAIGGQYSIALNAVPAVPEPETYALMLAGLGAVGFMARRRRQRD